MIIQIRGTSGSGKSTAMREVMEAGDRWISEYVEGRRQPLFYKRGDQCVLGHYETPCGGGDTVGSARRIFELIKELEPIFGVILCEGLLLSEDTKWSSQLENLRVVFLTTPVEECLGRIRKRREEAGNTKPLSESNTRNRVAVIERARAKLINSGATCRRASSRQAPRIVLGWLKDA